MGKSRQTYSTFQTVVLIALRVVVGWHFLYEGIAKLYMPNWSSAGFLEVSRWVLADVFKWIAATPAVLHVVDMVNIWGQILIGLGLIAGCMTRVASIAGALMLGLYYVANPPLIGMDFGVPSEGSYLIVNKNLIYAFENGADFICVGMYDFQIVDDVNIALDVLKSDLQRRRPWRV